MLRICLGILFSVWINIVFAQNPTRCGSSYVLEQMILEDPKLENRINEIEREIQEHIAHGYRSPAVITIPVVIHVIHNGDPVGINQNISEPQIISQIEVLNNDFRRRNADTVNTPASFINDAADIKVEFCLAKQDPSGTPTNGILRYNYNQASYSTNFIENTIKPATIWPRSSYLNIWILKLSEGYLGYSTFPGSSQSRDGVVIDYRYFGCYPANPNTSPYNLGRTATHEVGHWLNLYHTFNGGCGSTCATTGDLVCDTPPASAANYGCQASSASCGPVNMVQNYMDYSNDACMNLFTKGQRDRIIAVLNGTRSSLQTSNGCIPITGPPIPDFQANVTTACPSAIVEFTDMSLNATSWSWSFPGGFPSTSTNENPSVVYSSEGSFPVVLVVTNINGGDSIIKTDYITIELNGASTPYSYSFSSGVLQPAGWSIMNEDNAKTWALVTTKNSSGNNEKVAYVNNHSYNNPGEEDHIITQNIDLTGLTDPVIIFDVAYAAYSSQFSEGLKVSVSADCGNSFDPEIYSKSGASLATHPNATNEWFPVSAGDWRSDTVSLSDYTGEIIKIRFTNVNGYGNNLFIDNIQIGNANIWTPVVCIPPSQLSVSSVTQTSVMLDWYHVVNAVDYTIRAQALGESTWMLIDVPNGSNSFNATGLVNSSIYQWQVRSNCNAAGTNTSSYSSLDTFGLAAVNCNLPFNLSVSGISKNRATLIWDHFNNPEYFLIDWRCKDDMTWVEIDIDPVNNNYQISGLKPGKEYDWKIQSVCNASSNITSGYSPIMTFKTDSVADTTNVGIEQKELKDMFLAFPNPVNDILNISFEQPSEELTIELIDVSGRIVRRLDANFANFITINMREFHKGIYMLKLSTPEINVEEKIIKL